MQRFGAIRELDSGRRCDAAWLAREVGRRRSVLRRVGVGRGDVVVLAHGNSADFFADLFAVWSSGACAAAVNATVTAPELANIVDFMDPRAVLLALDSPHGAGLSAPVLSLAESRGGDDAADCESMGSALDDPALVLFTSGTTGTPKGVVHSFRSLLARTALNRAFIGDATLSRTLCVLPTYFGHGLIGNCLTPLMAGGELLLYPERGLEGARALGALLADEEVSFMSSVPAFWKLALKFGRPPPRATLRRVNVGSAPLSADLWRQVASWSGAGEVVNMYGITETANWFSGASSKDYDPSDGLIGRPWGGFAAVLGAEGTVAGEGEGELLVQTPSMMTGYHERPEVTASALSGGWYRTGDLGRIDADGVLHLHGRRQNEINRAGVKIHAEEIDLLLERHPDVVEACTFAIPDEISGEVVAVAVHLADDARGDATALRAWCGERIKPDSVPRRWFVVDKVPKTDRGKVNRDRVREHCLDGLPS
ncbi:MAG: fatty acid--CoA ligase family protein [Alphaproteobacteria bacterium]|nr:fatty acid--CoA ligase family protein [Alphaproteobacteria bacterium]